MTIKFWCGMLALAAWAQDATFRTTVPLVMAPVTVTDAKGNYIQGLNASDFTLTDDGRRMEVKLETPDTTSIPIALAIAVQANSNAATALLKIQKTGSLVEPLITGERGSAAILTYSSEVKLKQDFTSDSERITKTFRGLKPEDCGDSHMLDAVAESVRLLSHRPSNERRVLLVIGESRDRGSKTKVEEALRLVEREGVTVFSAVFSAYITPFTTKGRDMPPPGDENLLLLFTEPARLAKTNVAVALANYSGGRKMSFATFKSLERIISNTGEELHSQYLLTYRPSPASPGFHKIAVQVRERPDALIRSRAGYWATGAMGQ